jgi:hypothetical protein
MIPMRPAFLLVTILLLAAVAPGSVAPARAEEFVPGIADLPIMPGLNVQDDDVMVFDKPDGRIVQAAATGSTQAPEAVLRFYDATLPQLGWHASAPGHFAREGEDLTIQASQEAGRTIVRFTLSPAKP